MWSFGGPSDIDLLAKVLRVRFVQRVTPQALQFELRELPAVRDRNALATTLRGLLGDLGLKRRAEAAQPQRLPI